VALGYVVIALICGALYFQGQTVAVEEPEDAIPEPGE